MNILHLRHAWDLIKFVTSCIGKNGWYWHFTLLLGNLLAFALIKLAMLGIPSNNFSIRIIPYSSTPYFVLFGHLLIIVASIVLLWVKTYSEIKIKSIFRQVFGFVFIFLFSLYYASLLTVTGALLKEQKGGGHFDVFKKQIVVRDSEQKSETNLYVFAKATEVFMTTRALWFWPLEFRVDSSNCPHRDWLNDHSLNFVYQPTQSLIEVKNGDGDSCHLKITTTD